ncbi:MAG: hypothetical protein ACE5GJ_01455 [Gemmatimonadota bacterium]
MTDLPLDPIAIDVGSLVQRTVASLYSHLVTRPTGRAVRMAIENQIADAGRHALSLIDFSQVAVLDFSCADEVVAKLLQEYQDPAAPEAFFVFRGVRDPHRDPIEVVLLRQALAAVAETGPGRIELLGSVTDEEAGVWRRLEDRGLWSPEEIDEAHEVETLDRLVARRVAFRSPVSRRYHALSRLVHHLL